MQSKGKEMEEQRARLFYPQEAVVLDTPEGVHDFGAF